MFGISPLGWVHTLGSLPAIPIAIYMLVRYGRIVPQSALGKLYLLFMLIGSLSVFLIAKQPASNGIAVIAIVLLLAGFGIRHLSILKNSRVYIETICLSLSVFFLMLPAVSETLRRVPDGHPIVEDPKSPILLGALGVLAVVTVVGLALQLIHIYKTNKNSSAL